jgi:mono/diheme cytochrome c family protein
MRYMQIPPNLRRLWFGLLFGVVACLASAQNPVKPIKKGTAQPTRTLKGEELFRTYCAVCHGVGGKGDGPAADSLKKRPADLTQITRKNNGKFPELTVQRMIRGDDLVAAHGARDMPTWGAIFNEMSPDKELVEARVLALTGYIQQMQAK